MTLFKFLLQNYMFAKSGEILTLRLRQMAFKSILKQASSESRPYYNVYEFAIWVEETFSFSFEGIFAAYTVTQQSP